MNKGVKTALLLGALSGRWRLIGVLVGGSGGMMMPGAPAAEPMTNATMLAAIASGPSGPIFFKMVGPAQAVEHSRAAFDQMVGSLRKQ